MSNPPAGWYPDPDGTEAERYWSGSGWTEERRPKATIAPPNSGLGPEPVAPPAPGPGQSPDGPPQAAPPVESKRSGCFGIATGVMFGILGALVLGLGGCVAFVAISASSDDGQVSTQTSSPAGDSQSGDSESEDSEPDGDPEAGEEVEAGAEADEEVEGGAEADDIVSCERTTSQEIVLEVVNNSPKTSTYWLTVAFFDEAGNRVADQPTTLSDLRPGERAIESHFTFEEAGQTCEVVDVDRFAAESDPDELAEVGPCTIVGENALGGIEASLEVTNESPETSDYLIAVAFVDADGVRRGSGDVFIEAVRTGETAPGDVFGATSFQPGYSCEVVNADRTAS